MADAKQKRTGDKTNIIYLITLAIMIIGATLALIFRYKTTEYRNQAIKTGASAAEAAYQAGKDEAHASAYQSFFDRAKKHYRTTSDVNISIESVRKTADLNVLECYISDYFPYKENEVSACLKVTGKGCFIIDLNNAEYNVDSAQRIVYITLPHPVLQYLGETGEEDRGFEKDSIGNGSTQEGSEILDELRKTASIKLEEELEQEAAEKYQKEAEASAEKLLEGLVKAANPKVEDICVIIEFR